MADRYGKGTKLNCKRSDDPTGGVIVEERFGKINISKLVWAYIQKHVGENIVISSPWQ